MKPTLQITKREPNTNYRQTGARFFLDSNLIAVIDEWFHDNEIWSLKFKSSTWTKVKNLVARPISAAIEEHLQKETNFSFGKVSYSNKAGCSCGCSPGYVAKGVGVNGNFFGTAHFPAETVEEVKELLATKFLPMLKKEISTHA